MRPRGSRVGGVVLGGLAGATLAACASLLGLDELPLERSGTFDGGSDASDAPIGLGDANDACPDVTTFCTLFCTPPPFCDDFEGIESPAARWSSPAGIDNPVLLNDAGLELEQLDGGNHVLFARAAAAGGNLGAALLVTTVRPSPTPAGIRLTAKLRLRSLDVLPDADDVPLRGVSMLVIGHHVANLGVGIGILEDEPGKGKVMFFESVLLSSKQEMTMRQEVLSAPLISFVQNALPVEIFIAPPALLTARGLPCDPQDAGDGAPEALHVVVTRFGQPQPCLALPASLGGGWLGEPTIFAGAAVEDFAAAAVQVDDIALTVLE